MTRAFACSVLFTMGIACCQSQSQSQHERTRPPYKIFAAVEPSQIEQILNQDAVDGYRLIAVGNAEGGGAMAIMRLLPTSAVSFNYKVIRSNWLTLDPRMRQNKPSALDLMNAAGGNGYRLVPEGMASDSWDCAFIMEKQSDESGSYEYRAFAPELLKKPRLEELIAHSENAHKEGFSTVYFGGDNYFPYVLISERVSTELISGRSGILDDHFYVVQMKEQFPLIQQEADAGFAVRTYTLSKTTPGFLDDGHPRVNLWTQKTGDHPLKVISLNQKKPHDFESLRSFLTEFQNRLNSSGEDLCDAGILIGFSQDPTFFHSNNTATMEIAMGSCPAGGRAIYRFALGANATDLGENINKLASEGYVLVPSSFDIQSALMEKSN
jgi:hypothetical protein